MPYAQKGFTLIELMVVVVITAILAATALPAYHRYIVKSRFTEVMTTAESYKLAVSLAIQLGNPLSECQSGQHGIPTFSSPTQNTASVSVNSGIITAVAADKAGGFDYILTPNAFGTRWTVSGSCLEEGICEA